MNLNPCSDCSPQTKAIVCFLWFLVLAGVAYVVVSVLCVWEFTLGIKESIKSLRKGGRDAK